MGKEAEGVEEREGGEIQQGKRRFWPFEFHPYSEKTDLLNWWLSIRHDMKEKITELTNSRIKTLAM